MLRLSDSTSFAAIATILMFMASSLLASITYDWASTGGGGSGTVVFNGGRGDTADPSTDILSFVFSNDILSDWSLADQGGSWTTPLSLTGSLTPQNDGVAFYFARDMGVDTRTLTFYYCAPPLPPVAGSPPPPIPEGLVGWSWDAKVYLGSDPLPEPSPKPEHEAPGGSGPPPIDSAVSDAGSGQWVQPGDSAAPPAPGVPAPASLLLALAGVGICRAALHARSLSPR